MPVINCEINFQLKWSRNFVLVADTAANQNPRFEINNTKIYFPAVTLSIQVNIKLLKQIEYGFKRAISWNNYLAKPKNQAQNRYLDFLIDKSFQGLNRLFVM